MPKGIKLRSCKIWKGNKHEVEMMVRKWRHGNYLAIPAPASPQARNTHCNRSSRARRLDHNLDFVLGKKYDWDRIWVVEFGWLLIYKVWWNWVFNLSFIKISILYILRLKTRKRNQNSFPRFIIDYISC